MDFRWLISISLLTVIVVSGCAMTGNYKCEDGSYTQSAEKCLVKCPDGSFKSSLNECPAFCGDDVCNYGENCSICSQDCGICSISPNNPMYCAINTNYVVDSATYDSATKRLTISITNKDSYPIYGFGVILDNGTVLLLLNSSNPLINQGGISPANKLVMGQKTSVIVNLSNTESGHSELGRTLTEVTVTNEACPAVRERISR